MKEDVEREVTDTQAAQTQLEKTADDFRCISTTAAIVEGNNSVKPSY